MKRLTAFNDVKQALATSSEHYRKFILNAISRAMKAPDLRLSRVLQRLMPNTELESLIKKLTSSRHLTNTVKDVFNLTDSTSKATLLSIMEQLNYIDYRKKKAEMIPVRHLIPSAKRLIDTTPTSTAQKNYNKGAK